MSLLFSARGANVEHYMNYSATSSPGGSPPACVLSVLEVLRGVTALTLECFEGQRYALSAPLPRGGCSVKSAEHPVPMGPTQEKEVLSTLSRWGLR